MYYSTPTLQYTTAVKNYGQAWGHSVLCKQEDLSSIPGTFMFFRELCVTNEVVFIAMPDT